MDQSFEALAAEVSALRDQVARQEAERRRSRRVLMGAAVVAALCGTIASAATGNCPNGLPVCFTAGSPALATDVNLNFAQLKEWLETKVGPASNAAITTGSSVTAAGGALIYTGTAPAVPVSAGRALFVTGPTTADANPIADFRHSNTTQGIGVGYNTISATGSNANQDLNLTAKGSGVVRINSPLEIGGNRLTKFTTTAAASASVTLNYGVSLWSATQDVDLSPAANAMCFVIGDDRSITATSLANGTWMSCRTIVSNGRWLLRASMTRGHHQETQIGLTCYAQCMQW